MVHRKKFTFCLLTLIFQALMRHKRICFKLFEMESSPANKIGGQIYQALGDLKFSATLEGLSQMGGLEFFTLFLGGGGVDVETGFSPLLEGMGGVPPPLAKNLLMPRPPGKVLPQWTPAPKVYLPTK